MNPTDGVRAIIAAAASFVESHPRPPTPKDPTEDRLLEELRTTEVAINGDRISVTCSIGIASARRDERVEELVDRADQAMYAAKDQGKDRTVVKD